MPSKKEGEFTGHIALKTYSGLVVEAYLAPGSYVYRGLPTLKMARVQNNGSPTPSSQESGDERAINLDPNQQLTGLLAKVKSQTQNPMQWSKLRLRGIKRDVGDGIEAQASLYSLLPEENNANFQIASCAIARLQLGGFDTVSTLAVADESQITRLWTTPLKYQWKVTSAKLALLLRDCARARVLSNIEENLIYL